MQRAVLALGVLFALGCGEETAPVGSSSGERPNILLLVAEDLGPRMGAFGDDLAVTPNLDRLAAEGTRFTNVFTAAGVCAPSRAALITGVHPNALGAGHMRTSSRPEGGYRAVPPAEVKAFPELMRAAGYHTFTNVKLDYQFSGPLPGSGPFTIWSDEGFRVDERGAPEGSPFFGMINFMVTHESSLFERGGLPTSPLEALHMWLMRGHEGGRVAPADVALPPYYPDTPAVRETLSHFYDQIHRMDEEVGEILARLDASGLSESTIVIFTTDHGDGLPRAKREVYDSGTHVPLIVRWPESLRPEGATPGGVEGRLVSFVDLAPTILSLAGLPAPEFVNGRVFLGPRAAAPRRYVYAARDRIDEQPDRVRSVRDARYRYVRNFLPETPASDGSAFRERLPIMRELRRLHEAGGLPPAGERWFQPRPREELYDTHVDPHEVDNLAGDPAHAETLTRLSAALDAWLARVPDLGALPEAELVERGWPGGESPTTAAPSFRPDATTGAIALESSTEGASIAWRSGRGPWQIYGAPFQASAGAELEARAIRYGWEESATVRFVVE
ncbi:MAG: sulfatase [Deltaproteobacteria bacterium]|nr:sulfatase [Deltaproteobacteria bacterium]MBW2447541.1 sulfatase [Deltaproteobacteria bacterium]